VVTAHHVSEGDLGPDLRGRQLLTGGEEPGMERLEPCEDRGVPSDHLVRPHEQQREARIAVDDLLR
jgi:hypothetical protein